VLLTSLAWLIVAGGALLAWRQPQPVAFQVQPPPATSTPAPTATPAPIKIEVAGAVQQPGIYELPTSARVADAIAAAGGLAANADEEALSLARALQDGEKLVAPTARPTGPASAAVNSSTPELVDAARGGDLNSAGPVDLNSASAQELEALPAIGPVTAQAIVDYRTANGPFRSVEEITKVKGIGAATLEKLKPLVTVGE
jgi:competence protein ComEA